MTNDSLPDAELDVLSCLWKYGELTANHICEKLIDSRPMTHSAVSTLLGRLLEKKMVSRRKVGRSYTYRSVKKAQRAGMQIVSDALERVLGGNPVAIVSSLFESRCPTEEELNQLQELVDRLRSEQSHSGAKS